MKDTAIAKIKAEMEADKANGYVQAVGAFLLEYVEQNPSVSPQLSAADKTIAKSLEAMRTEASKKKSNNVAVIAPQEGFAIVLKYFGIEGTVPTSFTVAPRETITVTTERTKPAKSTDFNVSIDDFLK